MDEDLDETTLHQLEEALNAKIYPWDRDYEGCRQLLLCQIRDDGRKREVVVPQLSEAHDPLNWSLKWKAITTFCATTVSFSLNLGSLALATMFGMPARREILMRDRPAANHGRHHFLHN
jgi:hypothetical protein